MALHASYPARLMRTALPKHMCAARMAIHADRVLFRNGIVGILAEPYRNVVLAPTCLHMRLARPVACFTSTRLFRAMRIQHHDFPHGGVLEAAILVFVARDTHLASDVAS